MRKITARILMLTFLLNLLICLPTEAGSIIFCNIDFENSSNPFGGMTLYNKENIITVEESGDGHRAVVKKINSNDCHMDYALGMKADSIVAEADFSFGDISSVITPFYFIGVADDEKTRGDMDAAYVGSDRGLYLAYSDGSNKLYTFEKDKVYRISFIVKLNSRVVDIYVDGTKLAEKVIKENKFKTVKTVRNWIRAGGGNSSFTMDNYRIYEAEVPSEELPDAWESILPDDGKQRIKASEIKQIFSERDVAYPRIFASEDDFQSILNSSDKAVWYKKVKNLADQKLNESVVKYELSDGYRLLPVSREVLSRMQLWGFMYRMTKNSKYYTRAMQELDAVCNFKDWHTEHFLDTAEMMTAAAIGYDWFYDAMTEKQRDTVANSIIEKGLEPTRLAYYGRLGTGGVAGSSMNFVTAANNMNAVDNSSAIIAASAVFEKNEELCSDIIEKAVRSLDYSLAKFAPDGAWEEGPNYWVYAMEYITRAMSALDHVFGSDFGLSEYDGLKNSANWAISIDSYNGVNSYHDTWDGMHIDTFALSGLGKKYSDAGVLRFRKNMIDQMNYMPSVYDILWCGNADENAEPENEMYARNAETVSVRDSWFNADGTINKDGLFFSTHGGRNDAYHSHIDAGAFVFDIMGERWAMDIPPEDYNLMIGKDNNTYYRRRAEGHNTVVINPTEDAGQVTNASSYVTEYNFSDKDAYAVYDMAQIYSAGANSYKRGFYVGENRRSLTVRDEISLKNTSDIYWFMHTKADIEPVENGAILTLNGKKLRLDVKSNCAFTVSKMDAKPLPSSPNPTQSSNNGISKVAIKLSGSGNVTVEVKLSPYDENISPMMNSNMSQWKYKTRENSDWTEYDFEDYSSGLPTGFTELNINNITNTVPADNAFGRENRALLVTQAKTKSSGADQWYQMRADVKSVNKRYQHIHYEQAYDNQFSDRWLILIFSDYNETRIPLFRFTRNDDMTPCFKVSDKSYGVQPIKFYWNSYDIIVDMQKMCYTVYVNNTLMGKDIQLSLKKDTELCGIEQLVFGFNHQWDSSQNAFAATSTYMDNIIVKPLDEMPIIGSTDEIRFSRENITCNSEYADTVAYEPKSGTAIVAHYDDKNLLKSVEYGSSKTETRVEKGERVVLMNWDALNGMRPNGEKVEFSVKY